MRDVKTRGATRSVVYVNNFAGAAIGGGEKHLLALATAARAAGWRPTIICRSGSGIAREAEARGLAVVEIALMSPFVPVTIVRLRRAFRRLGADLVHTAGFFVNQIGRVAARLARVRAIVSTVHCEPDSPIQFDSSARMRTAQRLRGALDNFTSRWAQVILADSQAIATKLVEQGVSPGKIKIVHNAVSANDIRAEIGASGPDIDLPPGLLVGTVGRLEAVKGLNFFIDAARVVCDRRDDASFLIVGDGPLASDLERQIRALGLEKRVILTGHVHSALAVMVRLNVYVLPSLSEGLNTTLLEALALHRPVVATDAGGNSEVIIDRETGLLVPARDSGALADAICRLLDNDQAASRLADAGQRMVVEKFSLEKMCAVTLGLYEELA